MKHYTLPRDIALHVIETDRFKTAAMTLNLIVPVDAATAPMNTLVWRVLKQGSANYPSLAAINTRLDDLYATELSSRNYKRGEMQIMGFALDMLDDAYVPDDTDVLGGALAMLGELLLHPLLDADGNFLPEIVEREKKTLCDNIRAQINNKQSYAQSQCTRAMCAGERFGLPLAGTVEEVEAITPAALTARYRAMLREARVEIFFIGQADADRLIDALSSVLAEYPEHTPLPAPTEIVREAREVKRVEEEMDIAQGKLVLGFRTGCTLVDVADYPALLLMSEMYGGSPASKLFVNVREKLSLCYYCHAYPDGYKGLMYVSSGVAAENREKAEAEILAQLEAIRRGDFTDEEMENAIRSLEDNYRKSDDRPFTLENYYLGRMLFGVDVTIEQMRDCFRAVSREAVIEAAGRVSLDTVYFLRGPAGAGTGEEEEEDE